MVVYRAPTGNFNLFLNRLDDLIKSIYKTNSNLILWGDINIDYLTENDRKRQLDSMLQMYNLTAIVTMNCMKCLTIQISLFTLKSRD